MSTIPRKAVDVALVDHSDINYEKDENVAVALYPRASTASLPQNTFPQPNGANSLYYRLFQNISKVRIVVFVASIFFLIGSIIIRLATLLSLNAPIAQVRNPEVGYIQKFYFTKMCGQISHSAPYLCSPRMLKPHLSEMEFYLNNDTTWQSFPSSIRDNFAGELLRPQTELVPLVIAVICLIFFNLILAVISNGVMLMHERSALFLYVDRSSLSSHAYISSMIFGLFTFALCATVSITQAYTTRGSFIRVCEHGISLAANTMTRKGLTFDQRFASANWEYITNTPLYASSWVSDAFVACATFIQIFAHFHMFFLPDCLLRDSS